MTDTPTDSWPTVETIHGGEPPYAPPPPPPPPPEPDRRFGAGMLLALAVLALAAGGVAIAYFLTHRDNGSDVTTTVVTTSGTAAAGKTMPKLAGKKLAAAKTTLLALGIEPTVTPQTSKQPAGTVLAQAPEAGTTLTQATPVTLVVAQAKPRQGTTTTQATTSTGATATAPTTTAPTTTVSSTPPPATTATVPDVSNQTEATAVQSLNRAGIIASLAFVPGSEPLGTVKGQAKQAGTTVKYHSHMQINLSSGPGDKPEEQVPNVIGQPLQQALAAINGANLRLLYLKFPVTSKSQSGKIVQQSPLAGAQAPRNAQIVVYLGSFSG